MDRPSVDAGGAGLKVAVRTCVGCLACEVACKQEHRLPTGPGLIRVVQNLEKESAVGGGPQYRPVVCRHCRRAPCLDACPPGALARGGDGRVTVDEDACDGCGACLAACPFDAPYVPPGGGAVVLCDLCPERVAVGARPACVHHCPAGTLMFAVDASKEA